MKTDPREAESSSTCRAHLEWPLASRALPTPRGLSCVHRPGRAGSRASATRACAPARGPPAASATSGGGGASDSGLPQPPGGGRARTQAGPPGPCPLETITPADAGLDRAWLDQTPGSLGPVALPPGAPRPKQAPPGKRQVRPAHGQRPRSLRMTNRL